MKNTGHIHRALAYSAISLAGLFMIAFLMNAFIETEMLNEHTTHLEASVSQILSN